MPETRHAEARKKIHMDEGQTEKGKKTGRTGNRNEDQKRTYKCRGHRGWIDTDEYFLKQKVKSGATRDMCATNTDVGNKKKEKREEEKGWRVEAAAATAELFLTRA
jgi:hypothetical protein